MAYLRSVKRLRSQRAMPLLSVSSACVMQSVKYLLQKKNKTVYLLVIFGLLD